MTTLVLGPMCARMASAETTRCLGSMSTITGVAPQCKTMLAVAAYVIAGMMTSSPGPTPNQRNANSHAVVQLEKQATCGTAKNAANSSSNAASSGPDVIHPDCRTRVTAAMVSPSMGGGAKPIGLGVAMVQNTFRTPLLSRALNYTGRRCVLMLAERTFWANECLFLRSFAALIGK